MKVEQASWLGTVSVLCTITTSMLLHINELQSTKAMRFAGVYVWAKVVCGHPLTAPAVLLSINIGWFMVMVACLSGDLFLCP